MFYIFTAFSLAFMSLVTYTNRKEINYHERVSMAETKLPSENSVLKSDGIKMPGYNH